MSGRANRLSRWFPPARWLHEYRVEWLRSDIVAGATLAAYAIPVALAYASLAGLPPQYGLYTVLGASVLYAVFASTRQVVTGPSASVAAVTAPVAALRPAHGPRAGTRLL